MATTTTTGETVRFVAPHRGGKVHATTADVRDLSPRTLCGRDAAGMTSTHATAPTCKRCAGKTDAGPSAKPVRRAVPSEPTHEAVTMKLSAGEAVKAARSACERVVIYLRLSRLDDDSTSLDSQERLCRAFATYKGWEVVAVLSDADVSGALPFAEREDGAKLIAMIEGRQIDHVVAWKLDRLGRNAHESLGLFKLAKSHRVSLWTQDGQVTPDTMALVAPILAVVAEWEREQIRARVLTAKETLRTTGRWPGGNAPYGMRICPHPDGTGKALEPHPETAPRVREMATRIANGTRVGTIVAELNDAGIPSPADQARIDKGREPKGSRWTQTALEDTLTNPTLTGRLMHDPRPAEDKVDADGKRIKLPQSELRPVLDRDGEPVMVSETAVLSDAELHAVTAAIKGRYRGQSVRQTDTLLSGVVICDVCSQPMHHNARRDRGTASYRCKNKCGVTIQRHHLEPYVISEVLTALGDLELLERGPEVASVAGEIAATRTAFHNVAEQMSSVPAGSRRGRLLADQLEALEAKLDRLEAQEMRAGTAEWVPTGETFAGRWQRSDIPARRAMLMEYGVTVAVRPSTKRGTRYFDESRVTIAMRGPEWAVMVSGPDDGPDLDAVMADIARDDLTAEELAEVLDAA
ncbi:recombinase family protein [Actinomadura sp. SCN-SB]|uniref:recombinase family protein n=1 Tax=Actinomadura sp. SCN-SB TaxID=3373092 RepID=UPI0037523149